MDAVGSGRENLEYLQAHMLAVHGGLQAVVELLGGLPPGHLVRAASVHALLLPLADEAAQGEPLAQMLLFQCDEAEAALVQ